MARQIPLKNTTRLESEIINLNHKANFIKEDIGRAIEKYKQAEKILRVNKEQFKSA